MHIYSLISDAATLDIFPKCSGEDLTILRTLSNMHNHTWVFPSHHLCTRYRIVEFVGAICCSIILQFIFLKDWK